jgi:hypothetical protein
MAVRSTHRTEEVPEMDVQRFARAIRAPGVTDLIEGILDDSKAAGMVYEAGLAYTRAEGSLRKAVQSVRTVCSYVEATLDAGNPVNPNGELQGRGNDLDRFCTELEAAARALGMIAFGLLDEDQIEMIYEAGAVRA